MKKFTHTALTVCSAMILALPLTACGGTAAPNAGSQSGESSAGTVSVTLVADFSAGNPDGEANGLVRQTSVELAGKPDVKALADALSAWTGLDFLLLDGRVDGGSAYADWSAASTLIGGLDDREQKEDFHFFDAISLNWFMMDSLLRTIRENLPVETVYYSMDGGQDLQFLIPEDMAAQGLPFLPADQPYEGSAFFVTHADGRGDLFEESDMGDDLPSWNGFDFGPNLSYAEEIAPQGDFGDYPSPAEAAMLTFRAMRDDGRIQDYSDAKEYLMTLVDLAEINGEECYVYRCEDGESYGAGFAYAYQSGSVYMQGQGGQWVRPE